MQRPLTNQMMEIEAEVSLIDGEMEFSKKSKNLGFACTFAECRAFFNRQWKLERHLCSHTGQRPFRCDKDGCSKAYQCRHHLVRHLKTAHVNHKLSLHCSVPTCKATFSSLVALKKHVGNHGRPRHFQCSTCGVSFQKREKYNRHVMGHSDKSLFTCTICNLLCVSQTLLRRHMKSHTERKCTFDDCSYICDSRSVMRKHEKVDHPSVYNCAGCNKSFNNKGSLRDHVMIHLPPGQRGVFACPHRPCRRFYLQLRNLQHHIKVYHNFPRFYCSAKPCTASFVSEVKLEKHMLRKHSSHKGKRKEAIISNLTSICPAIEDSDNLDAELKEKGSSHSQFELLVTNKDHF